MSNDDPFADPGEGEKTVIRPRPGGSRGGHAAPIERPAPPPPPSTGGGAPPPMPSPREATGGLEALSTTGVNPLVGMAAPMLRLAAELRVTARLDDIEGLRNRITAEIKEFETRALRAQMPNQQARAARYVLCALADDVVLNTPWGGGSIWANRTMVGTFHNETYGGERFFEILDHMNKDPGGNLDVLELLYVCLSLGFQGKYRIVERGGAEVDRIRESLYRTIANHRGAFERSLSIHWKGLDAPHRVARAFVPAWLMALIAVLIVTGVFAGLSFTLNQRSDETVRVLAGLAPGLPVAIAREAPPLPPPVVVTSQFERIEGFLQPEIAEGLVSVREDANTIGVRITGSGLFASGSDTLTARFEPVVDRVARALIDEPGRVVVEGHSDNVPIRTLRFPSNYDLSLARAQSVMKRMAGIVGTPDRFTSEGLAETRPIASNDTAEGRAINRRIEVVLVKEAP